MHCIQKILKTTGNNSIQETMVQESNPRQTQNFAKTNQLTYRSISGHQFSGTLLLTYRTKMYIAMHIHAPRRPKTFKFKLQQIHKHGNMLQSIDNRQLSGQMNNLSSVGLLLANNQYVVVLCHLSFSYLQGATNISK